MLVGCLAKAMVAGDLRSALESGYVEVIATPVSVARKFLKSNARKLNKKTPGRPKPLEPRGGRCVCVCVHDHSRTRRRFSRAPGRSV